ncbi:MAG: HU family DNA-binding protein [Chitinophagales bacterium]
MRKADIVNRITEKTGLEKVDVMVVVEAFCKEIREAMADGHNVYVRGFGSFIVKTRKKKIGRIIKKNIAIEIPEQKIPAFKPSKMFVNRVRDGKKNKITPIE